MTREEAINRIQAMLYYMDSPITNEGEQKDIEAYRMAIKALKQEPCDDAISRKSIKQKLQEHHDFFVSAYGGFSNLSQNDKSRVDELISCIAMVVNEPSVRPQEPNGDAISRQVVLDELNKWDWQELYLPIHFKENIVDVVPSVKPQEQTGHWIEKEDFNGDTYYDCSECGESFTLIDGTPTDNLYNFCPNCGVDMRENEVTE